MWKVCTSFVLCVFISLAFPRSRSTLLVPRNTFRVAILRFALDFFSEKCEMRVKCILSPANRNGSLFFFLPFNVKSVSIKIVHLVGCTTFEMWSIMALLNFHFTSSTRRVVQKEIALAKWENEIGEKSGIKQLAKWVAMNSASETIKT